MTGYVKADWEYPREDEHYFTFPASQVLYSSVVTLQETGVDFPVSGDLSTLAGALVDFGVPAPVHRDEDMQAPMAERGVCSP